MRIQKTYPQSINKFKICFYIIQKQKQIKLFEMSENHQNTTNGKRKITKNASTEYIKQIQWGESQANSNQTAAHITTLKQDPFPNQSDEQFNKKNVNQIEEEHQYYTEYSQVSAIQTGFKKLKTNQIQILKELKKEYEVLRNSSLNSRVLLNNKLTSESQSNGDSNSVSQSEAQSSVNSKNNQSRHKRHQSKEIRLANLQKKQLQLMLNNSMKKIEELLHGQIDLKKTVLQLKRKLEDKQFSESEHGVIMRRSKESEEILQNSLQDYKKQNESLRSKVKELILMVGNLEGNVNIKQVQLKKKQQKMKLLQEEIHLGRNKYTSLELDLKKIKMEYDILEKSKNQEISLVVKNKNNIEEQVANQKNLIIKKLKEQLEIKQERYLILLNKFNNNTYNQNPKQQSKQYNRNVQKLLQTLKEEKSQQNNESITLILSKLSQLQHKPDQNLLLEINNLRRQLQIVKQSSSTNRNDRKQKSTGSHQQRVRELEKIIQQENIEKIYFMQDLKKLTKDHTTIKREKEDLLKQIKDLKNVIDKLDLQNRRYRKQIDMIKNVNVDLTESQHRNTNLMVKLQHMNLRQMQISNVREEFSKRLDECRLREQSYEEQIRVAKRELHQLEFKVFKQHEENQLKLKLIKIQHESQLNRLQEDLQRTKKNYALQKNDLVNQNIQLQKKILDKNKDLEENNEKVTSSLKDKESYLEKIKADQELLIKKEQQRYNIDINNLFAKIENLSAANERLLQQSHKYAIIEQEILELKKLMKMNRKITDSVDHLWQVKQAEYSNINEVLKLFK